MSDEKKEEALDNVSGGISTHPFPIKDKPRPFPPTHPVGPTNPVGK
ncbi:MAG: hypothetical protein ABSF08_06660 [Candidatus Cybelea sp.]